MLLKHGFHRLATLLRFETTGNQSLKLGQISKYFITLNNPSKATGENRGQIWNFLTLCKI